MNRYYGPLGYCPTIFHCIYTVQNAYNVFRRSRENPRCEQNVHKPALNLAPHCKWLYYKWYALYLQHGQLKSHFNCLLWTICFGQLSKPYCFCTTYLNELCCYGEEMTQPTAPKQPRTSVVHPKYSRTANAKVGRPLYVRYTSMFGCTFADVRRTYNNGCTTDIHFRTSEMHPLVDVPSSC